MLPSLLTVTVTFDAVVVDGLHLGAGEDLDAEFLVPLLDLLGDLGVLSWAAPVQELHDGHVDAVVLRT